MNALLRREGRTLKTNYQLQNFYTRYLKTSCCACCTADYTNVATEKECEHTQRKSTSTISGSLRTVVIPLNLFQNQSVYRYGYYYSGHGFRHLHASRSLLESSTSKIDVTVKKLKNQQKEKVEEIMKEVANGQASTKTAAAAATATAGADVNDNAKPADAARSSATSLTQAADKSVAKPKKSLGLRIWEEVVHYYHGFRLLFIDVAICSKLLWRVLNGKSLTRRENKQLQRTTSDLFRLIPFSVFVIVPFMELLLPVFIKFFPGMLPSTFQTAKDQQDKLRQSLGVRLEVAKFLQKTLDQMPVQHKEHSSEEAKQFEAFFTKIRHPSENVSNEDIIKFAKRFDDEITLDSLSREQLAALCRVLELNTLGTSNLLRFQLRLKLRSLATDDRVIVREGVDTLDLIELQQACKARGMRAYGLTEERLRSQLKEWIDLSLNEQVPPTLLLLSRAMLISDEGNATDKLKETMKVLPDAVGAHTRHAIGESEGKVDNKTKIEIIKEEERRIMEERAEEHEEVIAKRSAIKDEQPAPYVFAEQLNSAKHVLEHKETPQPVASVSDKGISSTDVQMLSDALNTLSSDKQLVVEKETIKELKEELRDYQEDVEELREVRQVVKEPVRESRAAKLLYNRVNKMISQLDGVLNDLENRQMQIKQASAIDCLEAESSTERHPTVQIDELVATIKRMREASDEERFKAVEELLVKLDADQDGVISVNEITKAVHSIDSQATNIDKKQLEEFAQLLTTQATKRRNEEIVHIDDLMKNIKKLKETSDDARLKHIEQVLDKFDADKDGVITINEIRKVMESIGRDNIKLNEKAIDELICLLDKEQILHAEEKIEKAIARSLKDAEKLKAEVDKKDKELANLVDGLHDSAKEIKDIASDLGAMDIAKKLKSEAPFQDTAQTLKDCAKELSDETPKPPGRPEDNKTNPKRSAPPKDSKDPGPPKPSGGGGGGGGSISASAGSVTTEAVIREAAERQVEKLLPKDITLPPTIPPASPPIPPVTNKATAAASASPQTQSSANSSKKVL